MKNPNIIFLDFDGVLNSVKNYRWLQEQGLPTCDEYGTLFDDECVEALREITDATMSFSMTTSCPADALTSCGPTPKRVSPPKKLSRQLKPYSINSGASASFSE